MKRATLITLLLISLILANCNSTRSVAKYRPKNRSELQIEFIYPREWEIQITSTSIVLQMGIPYSISSPEEKVGDILIRKWGNADDTNIFFTKLKEQIINDEITRIKNDYTLESILINEHPAYKLKYKIFPENYPGVVWEIMTIENYFILINQEIYEVIFRIPEQNYDDPGVKMFYSFLETIDPTL